MHSLVRFFKKLNFVILSKILMVVLLSARNYCHHSLTRIFVRVAIKLKLKSNIEKRQSSHIILPEM